MASLGKPLVVIGVLLLISAGSGASRAPTTGRLVGMFLPGVLCLAAGARLGGMRARPASEAVWAEPGTEADEGVDRLQRAATLGVLGGISLIALGGVAARLGPLGVTLTRIASGVPHGGDLEFADPITMGRALSGRQRL